MPNIATTDYRQGEILPLGFNFEITTGTGTVTSTDLESTLTLYGPTGDIVYSIDAVPGGRVEFNEDFTGGTLDFDFDTTSMTPNVYYAIGTLSPVASDLRTRLLEPSIQVRVLPKVEMIATFDPLTARGRLRRELRDISDFEVPGTGVGITNALFSDNEVDAFLYQVAPTLAPGGSYTTLNNQTLYMAAYYGWMRVAAEKATLVKSKKILFIQSNTMPTYQAAQMLAEKYLEMAGNEAPAAFGSGTTSTLPGIQRVDRCADEFGHVLYSGHRNPYY